MGKLPVVLAVLALVTCGVGSATAQTDVLVNGDLEESVSPVDWLLTTSITGEPSTVTIPNVVEHNDCCIQPTTPPGLRGLLLHPQVGNTGLYQGQDKAVNMVLTQTVPVLAEKAFTFTGNSFVQAAYSGIVDMLSDVSPLGDYTEDFVTDAADYTKWRDTLGSTTDLDANGANTGASEFIIDGADYAVWKANFGRKSHGAIPSPTETTFKVEFLNASNAVLGTHTIDVRDDPTTEAWRTQTLPGIMSPPLTTQARVTIAALDMVASCTGTACLAGQDVYLDNFSLRQTTLPAGEKLKNGLLDLAGDPLGYTLTTGPPVDDGMGGFILPASAQFIGFADHTTPGSDGQGLWLKPFVNVTQFPLMPIPSVDAELSQVVPGIVGATYTFSAWTAWEEDYGGGLGDPTYLTTMKLEFLNGASAVIGSALLDLVAAGMVNDPLPADGIKNWTQFTLPGGAAPAGTVSVRISAGFTDGYLIEGGGAQSAFFDDFVLIQTGPGSGGLAAVPEPSSLLLVAIAVALAGAARRKR